MRFLHHLKCGAGRGAALALGSFILLNIAGEQVRPGFDMNHWWVYFGPASHKVTLPLLLLSGVILMALGIDALCAPWRRHMTVWILRMYILVTLVNTIQYYVLLGQGKIASLMPVPLSLCILLALRLSLSSVGSAKQQFTTRPMVPVALGAVMAALFMLGQIYCLGKTSYVRKSDIAVVFGARTYASGRCSDALKDRVQTAVELYHRGVVRRLLMTGGEGDGAIHETTAMRRLAERLGVPPGDIIVDRGGRSTRASVANIMSGEYAGSRIVAVSHFYHLPRIRMEFRRRGVHVLTVPAVESYNLTQMPWFVGREVAALTFAWLVP